MTTIQTNKQNKTNQTKYEGCDIKFKAISWTWYKVFTLQEVRISYAAKGYLIGIIILKFGNGIYPLIT